MTLRYDRLNTVQAGMLDRVRTPDRQARLATTVQRSARVENTSSERSQTMARMVLGLATSHSPQLSLPAEHWLKRGEEDRLNQSLYRVPDGKHVTFDELLAEVDPKIAQELTPEVFQKRYEANQKGIAKLAETLERMAPDVLVILGDDQQEAFTDDDMSELSLYLCEQVR